MKYENELREKFSFRWRDGSNFKVTSWLLATMESHQGQSRDNKRY